MRSVAIALVVGFFVMGSGAAHAAGLPRGYVCKKFNPYKGRPIPIRKLRDVRCTKRGAPTCLMFSTEPGRPPVCG